MQSPDRWLGIREVDDLAEQQVVGRTGVGEVFAYRDAAAASRLIDRRGVPDVPTCVR